MAEANVPRHDSGHPEPTQDVTSSAKHSSVFHVKQSRLRALATLGSECGFT
jgi:hypothetical protein